MKRARAVYTELRSAAYKKCTATKGRAAAVPSLKRVVPDSRACRQSHVLLCDCRVYLYATQRGDGTMTLRRPRAPTFCPRDRDTRRWGCRRLDPTRPSHERVSLCVYLYIYVCVCSVVLKGKTFSVKRTSNELATSLSVFVVVFFIDDVV